MKLAEDRFYKGQFNFKRCANGSLESVPMYSYDSHNNLYDVLYIGSDLGCRKNGIWCAPSQYHLAIIKHFDLD